MSRPEHVRLVEAPSPGRRQVVPNAVLGMLIFVITEAMLFAGLISAFLIVKSAAPGLIWPPPGQPRLPVESTAINTVVLLASGLALFYANRAYRSDPAKARGPLALALVCGVFFVGAQGMEWAAMLRQGLTMTSSTHGAFFYLIVGIHGLHAIAAIIGMGVMFAKLLRGTLEAPSFWAAQVFWYFVVGVWPVLYVQVYL